MRMDIWRPGLWSRRLYSRPPSVSREWRESSPRQRAATPSKVAIDEALKCKETGEEKTIVFGLTGTGYFDMMAYEKFHNKEMTDYIPTDEDLKKGFDGIPRFPGNMQ